MSTTRYKISVIEFDGDGESLKAAALYEQTVKVLDLRGIILAVNADAPLEILPIPAPRKRAPRSDRGKTRHPKDQQNLVGFANKPPYYPAEPPV